MFTTDYDDILAHEAALEKKSLGSELGLTTSDEFQQGVSSFIRTA